MTNATQTQSNPVVVTDDARGWYLYGITWGEPGAATLPVLDAADDAHTSDAAPLQVLECNGLAAIVRAVPLAEFSAPVIQERLRTAAALEEMVRSHNRVIEAVHAQRAILPAKFGSVYAHEHAVVEAIRVEYQALIGQLRRIEGCDEWAVHLYADPAVVRERVAAEDPSIRQLREQHAAARPGRAFFLERELNGSIEAATREALMNTAQDVFDSLARTAAAGKVSAIAADAGAGDEPEILRAAFLVARDDAARFEEQLNACTDPDAGLRCEYSGPWPPYSFAARDEATQ